MSLATTTNLTTPEGWSSTRDCLVSISNNKPSLPPIIRAKMCHDEIRTGQVCAIITLEAAHFKPASFIPGRILNEHPESEVQGALVLQELHSRATLLNPIEPRDQQSLRKRQMHNRRESEPPRYHGSPESTIPGHGGWRGLNAEPRQCRPGSAQGRMPSCCSGPSSRHSSSALRRDSPRTGFACFSWCEVEADSSGTRECG